MHWKWKCENDFQYISQKNKSDVKISSTCIEKEKKTFSINLIYSEKTFSIKISDNNKRKAAQIASYDTSMILALLTHTFMSL